jgi:hypothetical protein
LRNSTVFARKTIAVTSLLALLALFSVLMHGAADAQSRWPPWQSYGEAEDLSRKKPRKARPGETALLNRQIAKLKAAGKYAEAIPLAQKAPMHSIRSPRSMRHRTITRKPSRS